MHIISSSADARYTWFIKNYPKLFAKVPCKEIASYLGITPEFLSRVRKDILMK